MSLIVCRPIDDIAGVYWPMDDVCRRLGLNLAKLRRERGLSQEAFADQAGIHRTYISDIERGSRNPTITVVAKIAKALGVSLGSLLD